MIRIRSLLDELPPDSIARLCAARDINARGNAARESLARSYRGGHETFFNDLLKKDLVQLLGSPTEFDDGLYFLPEAAAYSVADLREFALEAFVDYDVPREFEQADKNSGESDDLDDDTQDEGDDVDDAEHDDDHDADEDDSTLSDDVFDFDGARSVQPARDYQESLIDALEKAVAAAQPGKRLRITVATGGGKTRIANDWIWAHAWPSNRRVLWITKDWSLLRQAASDLCRRRRGVLKRLGYIGSKGARFLGPLAERASADVVYTTIHTWQSRKESDFARTKFDVVVIDESHWGEGKRAYRELHKQYKDCAVFVGLTATPRQGTGFTSIGLEYDYHTLARMGVLARRVEAPDVHTGLNWSPTMSTSHGDYDRASLSKLARNSKRNKLIVDSYVNGREVFGKTLIFACDIDHAVELGRALQDRDLSAEVVHSGMRLELQQRAIQRFSEGRIRVLVNVAMMTHGIDIPDIETVFLARPTASRTLFAQMVGRAVRKTETKSYFRLVDFVDVAKTHGDVLVSPTKYFGEVGTQSSSTARYARAPQRAAHQYARAPFEHIPKLVGYEELAGLDIQPDQTFGIEFELTRYGFKHGEQPSDWNKVARALLEAIPAKKAASPHAEYHAEEKDHAVWNVEYDASCGWEVTSRVLSGSSGCFEVSDVCEALERAAAAQGLSLSTTTGTHIHLGWRPSLDSLRRLMRLVAQFEPALYSLVAPSRSGNPYCEPIRKHLDKLLGLPSLQSWATHFEKRERRFLTVNPMNLFEGFGTIEVRLHSGTIEALKILGWMSLWMRLLEAAQSDRPIPTLDAPVSALPLVKGPQGDVGALADFVTAHRELSDYLRRRRNVVMEQWLKSSQHGPTARAVATTWV